MSGLSQARVEQLYVAGIDAVESVTAGLSAQDWSAPACGEWSGTDTARHLVAVADWYHEWLDRAVAGDATAPFAVDEFAHRNQAGVDAHSRLHGPEAVAVFADKARRYLDRVRSEWGRTYGYPRGTITAGLHCGIAAIEWHLHAWDLSTTQSARLMPQDPAGLLVAGAFGTAETENKLKRQIIRLAAPIAAKRDPWQRLLQESGRV